MARARQALDEMIIEGIKTNIPLHKDLLNDENEIKGGVSIHYLEEKLEGKQPTVAAPAPEASQTKAPAKSESKKTTRKKA